MSNFGISRLRLVNPYRMAFREARSAVGASAILESAEEFNTVADAVGDCSLVVGTTAVRDRDLKNPVQQLGQESASSIRNHLQTDRVALLFGSEKIGLTNQDFTYCHWLLTIPTHEMNISMNLGQAVAVCLYEISRGMKKALAKKEKPEKRATAAEVERISIILLEALHRSGYVKANAVASTEERVRRMVRRLELSSEDAELWLGMFRQMLWKIKEGAAKE